MATKVNIDGLSEAIADALEGFDHEVKDKSKQVVKRVARKCKKNISAAAPKKSGEYAKSWASKTTKNTEDSLEITLYSKMPGLPHLLEHGHVINLHGTILGVGGARPHIGKAEQEASKDLVKELEKIL